MPQPGWKCFDCEEPGSHRSRNADKLVKLHANALNMLAAATLQLDMASHGPMVAFLNALNPTLGDATGQEVFNSGIASPQRLLGMSVEEVRSYCVGYSADGIARQWEKFHADILSQTKLSDFDLFTLRKTITTWLRTGGYGAANAWH
jgi:hypothetical protein